jgi:hypothetical protein
MRPPSPVRLLWLLAAFTFTANSAPAWAASGWEIHPAQVCSGCYPVDARVVDDGSGGAYFVWIGSGGGSGARLFIQRLTCEGLPAPGWPVGGRAVTAPDAGAHGPGILSLDSGGVLVCWFRPTVDTTYTVHAVRLLPDGSAASGWPDTGSVIARTGVPSGNTVPDAAYGLKLVPDPSGGAILVWNDYAAGIVRAQRILAAGGTAPGWPADGLVVARDPDHWIYDAHVIADGQGGAFIAWQVDFEISIPNWMDTVRLIRITASGQVAAGWPAGGLLLSGGIDDDKGPHLDLFADGQGGALVTWFMQYAYVDEWLYGAVFCQRVTPGGQLAAGWPQLGRPFLTSTLYWGTYVPASDGLGGLLLESDDGWNSHALRVTGGGVAATGWPAEGLSRVPGILAVAHDGSGGAFLVSQASRHDVMVARVNGAGQRPAGWPETGLTLCVGSGERRQMAAIPDGRGGAIIMWVDSRTSPKADLYAARVDSAPTGSPVSADGAGAPPPASLAIRHITPNPSGGEVRIDFELPAAAPASIQIYDPSGRRVRTLTAGGPGTGRFSSTWDGRDGAGKSAAAGVYFIRLTSGGQAAVRRVVLAR